MNNIIIYCCRFDPFYCKWDPEPLWETVAAAGGSVHAGAAGELLFYVPERLISFVLLRYPGLRLDRNRCML